MQIEDQEFPDDALGLLASDNSLLGAPSWRFMRFSVCPEALARHGLHRLRKAEWRLQLERPEVAVALGEVWASVYVGEQPGIAMAPAVDDSGYIIVRDLLRTLTARAAVACVLRLAPCGLVLIIALRPPGSRLHGTTRHSDLHSSMLL